MKVQQVILVTTDNDQYLHNWNYVSQVWRERFDIEPVLYFLGKPDAYHRLKSTRVLSERYGPVCFVTRKDPIEYPPRDWQAPAALLWAAAHHPGDPGTIRTVAGVDVIPIGRQTEDLLSQYPDDRFVLPFAGAYLPGTPHDWGARVQRLFRDRYQYYPLGRATAAARTWRQVLDVNERFQDFIMKLGSMDLAPMYEGPGRWGLEEAYVSRQIHRQAGLKRIELPSQFFWGTAHPSRLKFRGAYDPKDVRSGWYGECNGVRWLKPGDPWVQELISHIPAKKL